MIKKIFIKLYHKPPKYFIDIIKKRQRRYNSKRIFKKYLNSTREKNLQIGCGGNELDGWLNTDIFTKKDKVAYLDAGRPFPLPNDSFHYIYSEHIFEHLNLNQGLIMLKECYRVLKPGGRIRLATPDLDFLIKLYTNPGKELHKKYVNWSTNNFVHEVANNFDEREYISAFVINNFFRDWYHQVIYNFEGLELVLKRSGFKEIQKQDIGRSDFSVFKNIERHGNIIPDEFNRLETIVVEAVK